MFVHHILHQSLQLIQGGMLALAGTALAGTGAAMVVRMVMIMMMVMLMVMVVMFVMMMLVHRKSSLQFYFSSIISIEPTSVKSFIFYKRTPYGACGYRPDSV